MENTDNQGLTREEKISLAMKGNKNAEKWTDDVVLDILKRMDEYVSNNKCYYVGWLLDDFDLAPDFWSYIQEKFAGETSVIRTIKRIEQKLERSLVQAMLDGDVKETTGIFTLKSKHGWKDKQEHHHEVDPIQFNLKIG